LTGTGFLHGIIYPWACDYNTLYSETRIAQPTETHRRAKKIKGYLDFEYLKIRAHVELSYIII